MTSQLNTTALGATVCREILAALPNQPLIADSDSYAVHMTPTAVAYRPFVRLAPTTADICVAARTRDGIWGEKIGTTIAVRYPSFTDANAILSDEFRAQVRAAVDTKLAEIADLTV